MMVGVGAAVTATVPIMAASFIPLENALARLGTVAERTSTSLDTDLQSSLQNARAWSSQHVQSATEVVDAQFQLVTAGLTVKESLEGVSTAAVLATATGERLAGTAQLLASLFNTFGQTGSLATRDTQQAFVEMGDSIASTMQQFQVTLGPLAQGLAFVTGQAVQLGLSLNEVNVSLGILNTAGIKASNAGTGLQNVFIRMDDAIQKLNLDVNEFTDSAGNFTSIADFIEEVNRQLEGLTQMEKVLEIQRTFGQRAARTILVLGSQVEMLRKTTHAFDQSSGAAKRMQEIMERTTGSRLKIAVNNLKNLAQTIGQSLVPMLKGLADSFSGVLKLFTAATAKNPALVAAFIALGGAAVIVTGAMLGFKAILVLVGKQALITASMLGVLKAAFVAIAGPLAIGAAIVGLGLLIAKSIGAEEVLARLQGVGDTGFRDMASAIDSVTNKMAAARKEIENAARAQRELSSEILGKGGLSDSQVASIVGGERDLGKVFAEEIATKTAENFRSLGAEHLAPAFQEAVNDALANMKGIDAEDAVRGVGEYFDSLQMSALGGEGARGLVVMLGDIQKAEDNLVSAIRGSDLRSNLYGKDFDTSGVENAADALEAIRAVIGGINSGAGANDMVERFENLNPDQGRALREYAEDLNVFGREIIRNKELREEFAKTFPELNEVLGDSLGTSFKATFERTNGELKEVGKSAWQALVAKFTDNTGNNFTALAELEKRVKRVREVTEASISDKFGAALKTIGARSIVAASKISILTNKFTKLATRGAVLKDAMDTRGINKDNVESFVKNLDAQKSALKSIIVQTEQAFDSSAAFLDKARGDPELFNTEDFQKQKNIFESSSQSLVKLQAEYATLTNEAERYKNIQSQIGDQIVTLEGVKAAISGLGEAFGAMLDSGKFSDFKNTLFDGVRESLREGFMKGFAEAFSANKGISQLFDSAKIGEQLRNAIQAASKGGMFDRSKLDATSVASDITEHLGSIDEQRAKIEFLVDVHDKLRDRVHGLLGTEKQLAQFRRETAEEALSAFDAQAQAVARLQAQMMTSTAQQRVLLTDLIALQRGSGLISGGTDVATIADQDRIQQLGRIIREATEQGFSGIASAANRQLEDALTKVERTRLATQAAGDTVQAAQDAVTAVETQAASVQQAFQEAADTGATFATIKDDLVTGREAAEGIRDALASVSGGSTLPSSINVGGGSGGGSSSFTITRGGIQIVIEAGAAVTQADLNVLAGRLREESDAEIQGIIEELRQLRGK